MAVDMLAYRQSSPKRRDIVVFRKEGIYFVKRVIALGGDTIEGKAGSVLLNGTRLDEPYIEHIGDPPRELTEFGPVKIPSGKLFVMGDNRAVSLDSRMSNFGLLDEKIITGRALYIFAPTRHERTDLR